MLVSSGAAPAQRLSAFLENLEGWCVTVTRPLAFLGVIGMLIVSAVTMVDIVSALAVFIRRHSAQ